MNRRRFCKAAVAIPPLVAWKTHASLMMVSGNRAEAGAGGGGGSSSYTATHYVAPFASAGGSPANDYVDQGSTAWANAAATNETPVPCTLGTAYARAGTNGDGTDNIVECAPGTYNMPGVTDYYEDWFCPQVSGTATNPVVYYAEHPATENMGNTSLHSLLLQATAGSAPAFGIEADFVTDKHHIIFDGFSARQVAPNTFGSETSVCSLFYCDHIKLRRILFDQLGVGYDTGGANNWGAVFIQGGTDIEVSDCIFQNIPGVDENTSTFSLYECKHLNVHHCTFDGNWQDFYFKRGLSADGEILPVQVHHNVFKNWTSTDDSELRVHRVGQPGVETGFLDIYQNTFYAPSNSTIFSFLVFVAIDGNAPRNVRFVNNTVVLASLAGSVLFFNMETAGNTIMANSVIQNNIILPAGNMELADTNSGDLDELMAQMTAIDYNIYDNIDTWWNNGDLTQWQGEGADVNGLFEDPILENAGTGDLRLASGSPCFDAGQDVLQLLGGSATAAINLGAYITSDMSDVLGPRTAPSYTYDWIG